MKRNVAILEILLSLLLFSTSCGTQGTTLAVESAASSISVNETNNVMVTITNVTNLNAIEVHLSFDPNVVEVVEVVNNDFLQPEFVVQNVFDNTAGTVDYAIAQITQPPVSGTGTLITIVFRAKAAGSSAIGFRATNAVPEGALLADADGKAIQVTLVNGKLNVK